MSSSPKDPHCEGGALSSGQSRVTSLPFSNPRLLMICYAGHGPPVLPLSSAQPLERLGHCKDDFHCHKLALPRQLPTLLGCSPGPEE